MAISREIVTMKEAEEEKQEERENKSENREEKDKACEMSPTRSLGCHREPGAT